ncbi:anti-sigma factor [Pedobacter insulae]|uniref:Uncharacterized protein n=1 Tax=Pedobacter insulae TaxID=414048 RepID=A0A1I2XIX9_9SPHI|nr:hypothetical protein [Pedobacter insulae]SFH13365.1 hypothetical protein SAMN04489864_105270 [Pedobacter insulae]
MNTIDEQLWSYIDGNCTPDEQSKIEARLAIDVEYYTVYKGLIKVNEQLNNLDFEEPSMSFARNVMDKVNLELKPVALKTSIDNRIIYSIGAFFVLSILGLYIYAIATNTASFDFKMPTMNLDTGKYINAGTIQVFLLVDVALGLLYLDSFLRKRTFNTQKKGS